MILALAALSFSAAIGLTGVRIAMVWVRDGWEAWEPTPPVVVAVGSWFLAPVLGWLWSAVAGGGAERALWCVAACWILGVVYSVLARLGAGSQSGRSGRLALLYGLLAALVFAVAGGRPWLEWAAGALTVGCVLHGLAAAAFSLGGGHLVRSREVSYPRARL